MQKLRYSRYLKILILLIDLVGLVGIFLFFAYRSQSFSEADLSELAVYSLVLCALWFLLSGRTGIYSVPRNLTYTLYLESLFTHLFFFIAGFYFVVRLGKFSIFYDEFKQMAIVVLLLSLALKSLIFFALKLYRNLGRNARHVMFLGQSDSLILLREIIDARADYGYLIFDYDGDERDLDQITSFWEFHGIHTLFLPINNPYEKGEYNDILQKAIEAGVAVSLVPNNIYDQYYKYRISYFDIQPIFQMVEAPLQSAANRLIKRLFDLLFSLLVLIVIGIWLIPLVALLIKLDSKGPVFFSQNRYGLKNKIFKCFKFRTMVPNGESDVRPALENDDRITRLGHWLRKSSIDEFPQFINVLLGQMSVVGPRPHMLSVDDHYKPTIKKYSIRNTVKPGITGLAQIKGFRGDRPNMNLEMRKRIKADIFYVNNWSFILDLVIISKTLFILVFGDKSAH